MRTFMSRYWVLWLFYDDEPELVIAFQMRFLSLFSSFCMSKLINLSSKKSAHWDSKSISVQGSFPGYWITFPFFFLQNKKCDIWVKIWYVLAWTKVYTFGLPLKIWMSFLLKFPSRVIQRRCYQNSHSSQILKPSYLDLYLSEIWRP